jgi:DNA helicase IV
LIVRGGKPTHDFLEKYGLSYVDVDFTYLANRFWNLSRARYATEIPILHDVYAKNALLALEDNPSVAKMVYFDMLILDEAQDFTPMQFAAIQIISVSARSYSKGRRVQSVLSSFALMVSRLFLFASAEYFR